MRSFSTPQEMASHGRANPLIRVGSRRWFLQTSAAGIGSLFLPQLLHLQSTVQASPNSRDGKGDNSKAVILFWLSGGPSHIDMWDPKPTAPSEIRGPYRTIPTQLTGVRLSEHLPLQASIADKLSIIRSVDCQASDHTPITMQTGNPLARRTNDGRDGGGYPSMGSIASKFRGANDREMPAFVGLANSWDADVWEAGKMGSRHAPVKGHELSGRFELPAGISVKHLQDRERLRQELDRFSRQLDNTRSFDRVDRFTQQAYQMVKSGKVQRAFDLGAESITTREAYGSTSIGEKALLARRLVEAGVTFVLVSGAWGYFDHHGDNVRWGGIQQGLTPLLPRVDQVIFALVNDLESRGLLDNTLVMMMGEFGRSPMINKDAGRDHWTNVMSMIMAGGGLNHGQVIGSTDSHGGAIASSPVRPQDLAATTYKHLGVDLNAHWTDPTGRPVPIVVEGGRPIPELA